MAIFLNVAGSSIMLIFLLLLLWRGCFLLGWLPRAIHCPFAKETTPVTLTKNGASAKSAKQNRARIQQIACTEPESAMPISDAIFWFFAAILLSWFFVWIGFLCSGTQDYNRFLPYFYSRFTTAGDAPHYQYLAEHGYAHAGEQINLIVFYPLYPLCLRIARLFVGDTLLAGVLVSQLCWGLSAVALRRLAGRLYPQNRANLAPLAMVLFPFSFFALGVFTESLFLLLTILTLDAIQTGRFTKAGVFGCLAALCRTQGVVLFLAAVYGWLRAHPGKLGLQKWRSALPLLLIPGGYLTYLGLNWFYCGDPFAFLYYQSIAPWYQTADWIGNNLAQQWGMATAYPGLAKYIYLPEISLYFVAMLLLLYGVLAQAPLPLLLYGGAYIGVSYLSNWLISGSRYVFGCVVLYLLVAQIKQPKVQLIILTAEAAFLVYYACCFMQGQAIM